ncbi:MAG: hypothetical protein KDC44_24775, partial [Phaeodactylibacter sp.]|nr:hypothetical protein [Phaeodactylibacter sp.]
MSNNNGINFPNWFWGVAALLLLHWGCYQDVEGCLDVRAANFDVSADVACLDCCTFPELELIFQHRAVRSGDTLNFNYDSIFYLTGFPANPFRIEQIRYYISEVVLETTAGDLRVQDTIKLFKQNSSDLQGTPYIDDFLLVDRDFPSTYAVGTILGTGTVNAIRFRLGLSDVVRQTDPDKVTGGHPLALA